MSAPADAKKVLVRNRKARHDFEILATYEAGMALVGSEVKSLRESHASISEAYAEVRKGEVFLLNCKIEPYPWANQFNHEPLRPRKLLLHRAEIARIDGKLTAGATLVPLEIYVKAGKIKIEIALAKGRKQFEKRQAKRADEARREMDAATVRRSKG
jgi:SsrA-binding protein